MPANPGPPVRCGLAGRAVRPEDFPHEGPLGPVYRLSGLGRRQGGAETPRLRPPETGFSPAIPPQNCATPNAGPSVSEFAQAT